MAKIFGRNIGLGGSLERPKPTTADEELLRDLEEEGRITEFPSIVPKPIAERLKAVHGRTDDPRFRVAG